MGSSADLATAVSFGVQMLDFDTGAIACEDVGVSGPHAAITTVKLGRRSPICGARDHPSLVRERAAGAAHGAHGWLDQGANILLFGPPGGGKSHFAAALGLALVQNGRRLLFIRTTDLIQRLQVARRELGLEAAITKLEKCQLLILDDIAYVTKDQAETSVLFELIAARYERRSLLITARAPRHRPGDES